MDNKNIVKKAITIINSSQMSESLYITNDNRLFYITDEFTEIQDFNDNVNNGYKKISISYCKLFILDKKLNKWCKMRGDAEEQCRIKQVQKKDRAKYLKYFI